MLVMRVHCRKAWTTWPDLRHVLDVRGHAGGLLHVGPERTLVEEAAVPSDAVLESQVLAGGPDRWIWIAAGIVGVLPEIEAAPDGDALAQRHKVDDEDVAFDETVALVGRSIRASPRLPPKPERPRAARSEPKPGPGGTRRSSDHSIDVALQNGFVQRMKGVRVAQVPVRIRVQIDRDDQHFHASGAHDTPHKRFQIALTVWSRKQVHDHKHPLRHSPCGSRSLQEFLKSFGHRPILVPTMGCQPFLKVRRGPQLVIPWISMFVGRRRLGRSVVRHVMTVE